MYCVHTTFRFIVESSHKIDVSTVSVRYHLVLPIWLMHTRIRKLPVLWACARGGSKFSDKQFTPSEGPAHTFDQSCIVYFVFFFSSRVFLLQSFFIFLYVYIINFDFSQVSVAHQCNDMGGQIGLYVRYAMTTDVVCVSPSPCLVTAICIQYYAMYSIRVLEIAGNAYKIKQITNKWLALML